MSRASAFAKLNLALVVGDLREDATHDVATVLIRIDLHDDIALEPSDALAVEGFPDDTLVRGALAHLAETAGIEPSWHVRITKRIPVAAGLGGGSSDAAAALELANATLERPLPLGDLHDVARRIGADVPFFLRPGPQLATGDGTELEDVVLPLDFSVLLVAPDGQVKDSTREVYDAFDARAGSTGYEVRLVALRRALAGAKNPRDLTVLPPNDLASSPLAAELTELGAFRADVTGAGPAVYGLFEDQAAAEEARRRLATTGWTTIARPVA
jgi:4-diphosphocytidyl-2-C-methyl-D-erythritol kinase